MWKIALPVMDRTSAVSCVLIVETLDPLLLIYFDPAPRGDVLFDSCSHSLKLARDKKGGMSGCNGMGDVLIVRGYQTGSPLHPSSK